MRITLTTLQKMAQDGSRIAMLTCYDASFAAVLETAGVDSLLVGDSLGNVLQGHESTLPVTQRDMVYHTQCVARGSKRAFVIADMPFATFQVSPQDAFHNAAELMAAGAHMVKLEGGRPMLDTIEFLTDRGIPVCGHLGLTPQSVHALGGYRVQGRGEDEGQQLLKEAKLLEQAGAGMLVLHDMLDVYPGRKAKFVKNYMHNSSSIQGAVELYVKEVKARTFPGPEHSF